MNNCQPVCCQGVDIDDLEVRLGEHERRHVSEPLKHLDKRIERVIIHRRFHNITKEFDIALLKFKDGPIQFQVFSQDNSFVIKLTNAGKHHPHLLAHVLHQPGGVQRVGDRVGQDC